LILVHAENDEMILNANVENTVESYESSRPAVSEIEKIDKIASITGNVNKEEKVSKKLFSIKI